MFFNAHGIMEANGMWLVSSAVDDDNYNLCSSEPNWNANSISFLWQTAIKTFAEFPFGPRGSPISSNYERL